MHDPMVVAFTVPSPVPQRERWRDKHAEREGRRWGWLISRRTNPENQGQRTYRWWRLRGRNLVLAGQVYGLRDAFTVWHVEPKGYDAFTVCKRNTKWKWHVHHWRIQFHYEQRLRRFLLERCEHCGHRYPWGYAPVSHQWDSPRSRWRDGVVKRSYHHECSAALAWQGNNKEAEEIVRALFAAYRVERDLSETEAFDALTKGWEFRPRCRMQNVLGYERDDDYKLVKKPVRS